MDLLKIALLQIAPCGALSENFAKGIEYCRKAKEKGADIALFPEMWSCGYDIYERPAAEWRAEAIAADSDFVCTFGRLAEELNMAIGITLLEKCENAQQSQNTPQSQSAPRNSLVLFDRHGKRKLVYAKVHTCDFGAERNLTPGEDFYVTDLDTACGVVKVGAMICYDREFPESARILMLKGAELILVPNACPMEINRLAQLRGRAYENMTAIATCNYHETVPGSACHKKHMVKVCGVWYNICNYLLLRRAGQQIAESESRNAENANRVMQNLKRRKEKESVSYKRLPFGS